MSNTPKEPIAKSPSGRPKRVRVGAGRYLPYVEQDPDYVYRIVNDRDDRVYQFMQAGYEPVERSAVHTVDVVGDAPSSVGSKALVHVGGGQKALVMRIKREYYEADQEDKARQIDRMEQAQKDEMRRFSDYGRYGRDKNISLDE